MKALNKYTEKPMSECFEKYGTFFAFSDYQFEESKVAGVEYVNMGSGLCCPKDKAGEFSKEFNEITKNAKKQFLDENGKDEIILYELYNHECFYTGDYTPAFEIVEDYGFTLNDVRKVFKDNYAKATENF